MGFHAFFFAAFKVSTIFTPEKAPPLPYMTVDVDVQTAQKKIDFGEIVAGNFFSSEKGAFPSLSLLPMPQLKMEGGGTQAFFLMEPDFSSLEKLPYETPWKDKE